MKIQVHFSEDIKRPEKGVCRAAFLVTSLTEIPNIGETVEFTGEKDTRGIFVVRGRKLDYNFYDGETSIDARLTVVKVTDSMK